MTDEMPPDPFKPGDLNIPFVKGDFAVTNGEALGLGHAHLCGGLVIRAIAIETAIGWRPALIFDFKQVDGTSLPPVAFTCENLADFEAIKNLTYKSVNAAVEAAKKRNR